MQRIDDQVMDDGFVGVLGAGFGHVMSRRLSLDDAIHAEGKAIEAYHAVFVRGQGLHMNPVVRV